MATTIKLSTNESFLLWNLWNSTVCLLQERRFKVAASFMCSKSLPAAFFDHTLSNNLFPKSFAPTLPLCCIRLVVIRIFAPLMTASYRSRWLWNGQLVKYAWPLQQAQNSIVFFCSFMFVLERHIWLCGLHWQCTGINTFKDRYFQSSSATGTRRMSLRLQPWAFEPWPPWTSSEAVWLYIEFMIVQLV